MLRYAEQLLDLLSNTMQQFNLNKSVTEVNYLMVYLLESIKDLPGGISISAYRELK